MAVAIVQHKISVSGITVSFTTLPTVGNIIVAGFGKSISTQPANVTDNQTNTYTLKAAVKEGIDSGWSMLWTAPVLNSSGTFTLTFPSGGTMWIAEISGGDTSSIDHNTGFNNSTTPVNMSLSVSAANSLVIVCGYDEGTSAQTAGTGFTVTDNEVDNSSNERMVVESGTFGSGSASITWGNAVAPWSAAAIAIPPPAGTLTISVSDSLVITDSAVATQPGLTLSKSVSDSLSLSEAQAVVLAGVTLTVSKSDTIAITESRSVAISGDKNINKADTPIVLSESVSVGSPYPLYDETVLRLINHELDVAWKNQSNLSTKTFRIGSSTIGGMDIIGIDTGAIGAPSNYLYFNESDYVIGLSWEEALVQPIGGLNTSLAEAVLDNTSQRFTPEFMGGNGELYTATFEARKPIIIGADIDPHSPQVQFSGITSKTPAIDIKRGTISLSAVDYIDYFKSKPVHTSPMYTGQRSDQIMESLLLRAGMSTAQYTLETGQNTIGFAMFDTGVTLADAISSLVEAEDGQFYQDEQGKFHFENRLHYSNSPFNQSVATILESSVLDSQIPNQDQLINVVEVNYNPRVKTSSTTIFTLSGTITLPTGLSDVFLNFDNPVLAASAPVFTANNQSDGSGVNVTSSVNVHYTSLFAQAVKYSFNNTSGATAYITALSIQGRWAILRYDNAQYFRSQDDSSVTAYQEQKLTINNDYIQDSTWASSFATLVLNDYSDPAKLLDITIRAKPNLRRGDLITYKSYSWRIYRIRSTLDSSNGYIQELSLVNRGLASGSGVTYLKIGFSTIGGTDEIAP